MIATSLSKFCTAARVCASVRSAGGRGTYGGGREGDLRKVGSKHLVDLLFFVEFVLKNTPNYLFDRNQLSSIHTQCLAHFSKRSPSQDLPFLPPVNEEGSN